MSAFIFKFPPSRLMLTALTGAALALSTPTIAGDIKTAATDVGQSAAGHYLAGRHAEQVGEDANALSFYATAATDAQVATSDLYRRIYFLSLTEGRIGDALGALEKIESLGDKAPFANLLRAVHALKIGTYENVGELLKDRQTSLPGLLYPPLVAWAQIGENNLEGALEALEETNKSQPILRNYLLAAMYDMMGDSRQAEQHYLRVLQDSGMSLRLVELLGRHYEHTGETAKARELYEKFANESDLAGLAMLAELEKRLKTKKRAKLAVTTPQEGAAEGLFNIARVLQSQSGDDRVLVLAHLALFLRPDLEPAKMVVAAARESEGRHSEAAAIYERITKSSPLSWNARLQLADNLDRMDRTDTAIRLYETLARERPKQETALVEKGRVLRRHERFEEAIVAYSDALDRLDKPEHRHWPIYYARGIAYEQTQQWPKAEADFLKALEFEPDQPLVLNYLGYSWIDQGMHLERALKMIEKAVELRPRDGYIVDSLGWGLYRLEQFDKAVKKLERAVMLRPADPVINDHLGDALWQVGRKREARFQWKRARTLETDEKLLKLIERKLAVGLDAATQE